MQQPQDWKPLVNIVFWNIENLSVLNLCGFPSEQTIVPDSRAKLLNKFLLFSCIFRFQN